MSSERIFGEMPGVPIGTLFSNRQSLHDAEVHVVAPAKVMKLRPDQAREGEVKVVRDLAAL